MKSDAFPFLDDGSTRDILTHVARSRQQAFRPHLPHVRFVDILSRFQYNSGRCPMTGKKVLIVDYDQQSLEAMVKLLKTQKVQIIKAADGQAAYDKFKAEKPDLVILEAILPKIHGFDLTKKISQESGGRVPVIIVTGLYRGPQYKHEALSSFGAADYFEKPVDPEKFVGSVQQLLHDEEDIEEDLPDPESVIEHLSQKVKAKPHKPKEKAAREKDASA
jgi:DNA-binding response OmpR family regulator